MSASIRRGRDLSSYLAISGPQREQVNRSRFFVPVGEWPNLNIGR